MSWRTRLRILAVSRATIVGAMNWANWVIASFSL